MVATATSDRANPYEWRGPSTCSFWALTLGSVGVVYGDIGTSPLYAFREAVTAAVGADEGPTRAAVLGVLSLILWALILIVTLKYVLLLLRADNNGEGGTLTLMALAQRALGRSGGSVALLGIVGAGLFYGDALITPAISVLSAIEGLKVVTPAFEHVVVPLTVVVLVALFAVQSRGTAKVAAFFGPITVVWFAAIAVPGLVHVADDPTVLLALNPYYGLIFLVSHGDDRPRDARCRVPGGHRRRGAVRRPRAFRPQADPDRLVWLWCCRRWRSIISGRARWFCPIPRRSRIRFSCSIPNGPCCRWSCWRPRPPSSPARP